MCWKNQSLVPLRELKVVSWCLIFQCFLLHLGSPGHCSWFFAISFILSLLLESPLDCKEIQLVHPKGQMLKLKLQSFGHLMWRADSLEKTLMLGGIEGKRRRGRWRMRWLDGITGWMASLTRWTWVWVNSGSWWWTGRPGVLWFMGSQRVRHDWVTELNW